MHPSLLNQNDIDAYLSDGHWSTDTMAARCGTYARELPDKTACRDARETYSWARLDEVTNQLAANLIDLGLARDARALVQMPSSCREMVLRIGLKKAGIIGAFVPMQWRRKELRYVLDCIRPTLAVVTAETVDGLDEVIADVAHRVDLGGGRRDGWRSWSDLIDGHPDEAARARIPDRTFAFNEVSLITASSGTSGLAKLCEWPEAAQICVGRGIGERLAIKADDNIGIFSPMSGAAGVLVWTISGTTPCAFTFPETYHADALLDLVQRAEISVATTVPVILARLAQEDLAAYDLSSLRVLRVGTAAADCQAALSFETRTDCKVVIASGSMECPGFGHAHIDEPQAIRLDGSVGLPLPGCRLRIVDGTGTALPPDEIGELNVSAPFAASGYWNDLEMTAAAWSDGWYATGDVGFLDSGGRLTLKGRLKEMINRSGHKILPAEVEQEIARHPDIFDCAVVGAPDAEYGEVPWAFVQLHSGKPFDPRAITEMLNERGFAGYKIPVRIIEVPALPRIAGNKIDKKVLLDHAPPFDAINNGDKNHAQ